MYGNPGRPRKDGVPIPKRWYLAGRNVKPSTDPSVPRPLCKCGKNLRERQGTRKGRVYYRKTCHTCRGRTDPKYAPRPKKELTCKQCGVSFIGSASRAYCSKACANKWQWNWKRRSMNASCERCGFVPEHPYQLQVDHIIPRSKGGAVRDPANLQTLCANCHALKTATDLGLV